MGPISCPETSLRNYRSTLRKIPKERRIRLHRGREQKSRMKNPVLFLGGWGLWPLCGFRNKHQHIVVSFPGVNRPRRVDHPPLPTVEVQERVELYVGLPKHSGNLTIKKFRTVTPSFQRLFRSSPLGMHTAIPVCFP